MQTRIPPFLALILGCLLCPALSRAASIPHEVPNTSFEREALAFVESLERRPEAIRTSFAFPVCVERALTGLKLNPRLALRFGTNLAACFDDHVARPMAGAANVKIVAFHHENAEIRFLLRAAQRDGSLAYLDLVVERSRLASCAVIDVFDYSAGLKLSEIARSTIEARATEAQKNDHEWLLSSRSDSSKYAHAVEQFLQLAHQKDFAGAVAAFAKLPPAAQKERMTLRTQIRCAAPVDLLACSAALALWRISYPNDGATDLLALDYLKRKKLHDLYLATIGRIDQQVGGDAYLDVVRARYCQENCPGEKTEQFARQAVQRDPKMREGHQMLVSACLDKKDFAAVAQALSAQEKALGTDLGTTVRRESSNDSMQFAAFARSEAGGRWLAESETRRTQRLAKVKAAATSSNGQFQLEGINYAGGRAVATINGRTVGLGDRLIGGFRVSRIGPTSVNLVSPDGDVETLNLQQELVTADDLDESK